MRRLVKLAAPIAATNLCSFAISLVSLMFVGRLGDSQLSAAILATSVYNITGLSLLIGFAGAASAPRRAVHDAARASQVWHLCQACQGLATS